MSNAPVFVTDNLNSNRNNALPAETLQLVVFYDGAGLATLSFECVDNSGNLSWTQLSGIHKWYQRIHTAEYTIQGCTPTGNFQVQGVVPDGVVDGLAFGLMWKDVNGDYHILRSNGHTPSQSAIFAGAWPLSMDTALFDRHAKQVTDIVARGTAFALICGARLLPNGQHTCPLP